MHKGRPAARQLLRRAPGKITVDLLLKRPHARSAKLRPSRSTPSAERTTATLLVETQALHAVETVLELLGDVPGAVGAGVVDDRDRPGRDEVVGEEVGLVPEGTDTVPAAAVSGTAEDFAAAGAPDEEGPVELGGALKKAQESKQKIDDLTISEAEERQIGEACNTVPRK